MRTNVADRRLGLALGWRGAVLMLALIRPPAAILLSRQAPFG